MAEKECGVSGLGCFLAGLGLGVGLGAVLGVLYAPKAGEETREDIVNGARVAKEKAAELVEQGKEKAQETIDKGREFYEKGRTQWTQYVEKGKDLINDQQAKVEAAVEAGKAAYVSTSSETSI